MFEHYAAAFLVAVAAALSSCLELSRRELSPVVADRSPFVRWRCRTFRRHVREAVGVGRSDVSGSVLVRTGDLQQAEGLHQAPRSDLIERRETPNSTNCPNETNSSPLFCAPCRRCSISSRSRMRRSGFGDCCQAGDNMSSSRCGMKLVSHFRLRARGNRPSRHPPFLFALQRGDERLESVVGREEHERVSSS